MPHHICRLPHHAAVAAATTPAELLRAIYANRGLSADCEATPGLAALAPASVLQGLPAALARLEQELRSGGHFMVIGDYDADGATGCAVAVRGLRALGAAQVSYLLPSRFRFGYGLSPEVVELAAAQRPSLIITVDNGIASVAAVARANELGIAVLITDHHLPAEQLPAAVAIVNPNQPGCAFPSKHLAGVGVMFYLLAALRSQLRASGWFNPQRPEPNLNDLLDLVALGTVADVVPLDRNNRILVEQGLRRIRAGRGCIGIQALFQIAGRDPSRATATDFAFGIAPRLNAAGRLEEMTLGVDCLLADALPLALERAQTLDELNRRRHDLEEDMQGEAETLLELLTLDGAALPTALCLRDDGWHQGVIGIVAARLRERYHRPVLAFAAAQEGRLRGSGRSIPSVHLRDAIAQVKRDQPELIEHFGGHAQAAGLTIRAADYDRFQAAFNAAVRQQIGDLPPQPEFDSDGALPPQLLTLETAEALRLGGPWGKEFAEPCFDDVFIVQQARLLKERHVKLKVSTATGAVLDAIAFNCAESFPQLGQALRLVYQLDVNEYRGVRSPQLLVKTMQVSESP
jgi:single-stranded-DNA-specific exonuclease